MKITRIILTIATALTVAQFAPSGVPLAARSAQAEVTASIGADEAGGFAGGGMSWTISYDDSTRRVTAQADGTGNAVVDVQITTGGATRRVSFVQAGRDPFPNSDFIVIVGSGPTLIGPTIAPAQVARLVSKIGSVVGGLPFEDSWSRL